MGKKNGSASGARCAVVPCAPMAPISRRIESDPGLGGLVPGHAHGERRRPMLDQSRQGGGNLEWNPGAHQHVADPGEERAVERRQGRQHDLLQQVDADDAGVALAGEVDLDEARQHVELQQSAALRQRVTGDARETDSRSNASGHEIALHHALDEIRIRKTGHRPAEVAQRVAELQAARELDVERGPRDHSEPAGGSHRPRQAPARDADSHAALNDLRMTCLTMGELLVVRWMRIESAAS